MKIGTLRAASLTLTAACAFAAAASAQEQPQNYQIYTPAQPVDAAPQAQTRDTQSANAQAAAADTRGRVAITEENDYFFSENDRHYTQGLRASYLSAAVTPGGFWDAPFHVLSDSLPIFEGGSYKRKYDWTVIGQSIYTPQNTETTHPGPKAWPYGAWLYTGASLLQEDRHDDHNTLENFEVLAGVVGPAAFGNVTQNDFHEFIGDAPSLGWHNQLHDEAGVAVTYERKWRYRQELPANFAVDAIPELGATGGNIFTYGETGGLVRFGQNLGADYGPAHIRPSLSGTNWFDKTQMMSPLGWYVYTGAQGRAVARNIFLDGNTFESSPSVTHRPLVADFMFGGKVFWTDDISIDATYMDRTQEYFGQKGHDHYGSLNLAFAFW